MGSSQPLTFEQLYQAELASLVNLATFILGSRPAAEDAVHDSFLKLHATWFEADNPQAYVRRAVVNRCRDLLRSNKRLTAKLHLMGNETVAPSSDTGLDATAELLGALSRLEPRRRLIIVLRYYGGYQLAEIAEMLELPRGTVESNIYRGLDQLEGLLPDASRV